MSNNQILQNDFYKKVDVWWTDDIDGDRNRFFVVKKIL